MHRGPLVVVIETERSTAVRQLDANPVFQITFKGRVPTRGFDGSIDVGLPTPSQVYNLFCRVRWPAFSRF